MKHHQKGAANPFLIIIIVLLAAAVAYFAFIKKPQTVFEQIPVPTPAADTTSTSTSPKKSSAVALSIAEPASISKTGLYAEPQYNFQLQLAPGSSIPSTYLDPSGLYEISLNQQDGDKNRAIRNIAALDITKSGCPSNEMEGRENASTININGIPFIKTTGSGYAGGMESGSIDGYYCATNKDLSYTFILYNAYPRGDVGDVIPDVPSTMAAFDQEMKLVNFQFTK